MEKSILELQKLWGRFILFSWNTECVLMSCERDNLDFFARNVDSVCGISHSQLVLCCLVCDRKVTKYRKPWTRTVKITVAVVWERWSRIYGQGPFWGAVRRCSAALTLSSLHKILNDQLLCKISRLLPCLWLPSSGDFSRSSERSGWFKTWRL